jgi:AraC-like DNA-binding protein
MERENDERVNLLFELREEARHQFAQNTHIDPKTIGINPDEEVLVSKLVTAIEANITNEDYNVDQLASDVAMSRSKLYDKMRNMLGITPADFIRNVRLKRAAQLLTDDSTLTIAEISKRVGFATSRNFSTQFKKMFGVLPSEYREPKSD